MGQARQRLIQTLPGVGSLLFLVLLPLIAARAGPSDHASHRKGLKRPENPAPRPLL